VNIQSEFQKIPQIQGVEKIEAAPATAGQNAVVTHGANEEPKLSTAAVAISESAGLPDVRMDKVMSIQSALASGSYQVSSSDLAGKLIEQMKSNNS
jgi:negative regulator of flagellin synthesis FlgM